MKNAEEGNIFNKGDLSKIHIGLIARGCAGE